MAREARGVERRGRVVVEDDEVGGRAGLERAEQRLAEDAGRRAALRRRAARAASRRRRRRRPRAGGSTRRATPRTCRSRSRRCRAAVARRARDVRTADRVVHVRARVVRDRHSAPRDERRSRASSRWTPCASSVRSSSAPARASRSTLRVPPASRSSIASSAAWTCKPTPKSSATLDAGGERLVGERERGMRADEAAGERQALAPHALEEPPVLGEPGAARCPARRGRSSRSRGPCAAPSEPSASAITSSEPSMAFGEA